VNFLAHAYLSGGIRDLIIGNFIADSVKGKEYHSYREGIIKGILLHRKIDTFTDQHPIVFQTKTILRPYFGKYSSVVSDIYFDHFLALYWNEFSSEPLIDFTAYVYGIIKEELPKLPEEVQYFFPYMVKNNWLYNYQTMYGMERVFEGMSRRAKFDSNMEKGVEVLKENYIFFEEKFRQFFPLLNEYVQSIRE
jgi:acyl carrier protein phosphodiesterase